MSDWEFVNRKHWPSSGHSSKARELVRKRWSFQREVEMRLRNKGTACAAGNFVAGGPSVILCVTVSIQFKHTVFRCGGEWLTYT